jgi:hypothetical protein
MCAVLSSLQGFDRKRFSPQAFWDRGRAKMLFKILIATPLPESVRGKPPVFEGGMHQIGSQIRMPQKGAVGKLLN